MGMKLSLLFLLICFIYPIHADTSYTPNEDIWCYQSGGACYDLYAAHLLTQSRVDKNGETFQEFDTSATSCDDAIFNWKTTVNVASDATYDLNIYFCTDGDFSEATITWANRNTEVTEATCTLVSSYALDTLSTDTWYQTNITTNENADDTFTIKYIITPVDAGTGKYVYTYEYEQDNAQGSYVNCTSSYTPPPLTYTHISPLNNTRNNTNLFINYQTTLKANCSVFINGTFNQTQKDVTANSTQTFNVSMSNEDYYLYSINCSENKHDQTINSSNYVYNYDPNAPIITYVFPLLDNSSLVLYQGNVTVNVSCTDQYLYWTNFTIYKPNSSIYYNNDSNISMSTTIQENNLSIFNITDSGQWEIYTQCWDSHTDEEFKVRDVILDQTKQEWIFLTEKDDTISIEVSSSSIKNNIVEISTKWEYDRYTFNILADKDIKKGDQIIFNIKSNKDITYLPNSPYQGHFIIGMDYWLDFEGIPNTKVSYLGNNQVQVLFIDKVKKDKILFKSFGGLNYNEELAYFTVLNAPAPPSNGTVSCLECLNLTVNCSASYPINSSGWVNQQLICENYLNSLISIDDDINMIAIIMTQILLITFLVFTGVMTVRQYKYHDLSKTSFWLAFICFSLSIIEIMLTLGIIYVNEAEGSITGILYINLWVIGFTSFLISMAALSRIMFGYMDMTGDMEKIKEW